VREELTPVAVVEWVELEEESSARSASMMAFEEALEGELEEADKELTRPGNAGNDGNSWAEQ
jgi:hypothetical protein